MIVDEPYTINEKFGAERYEISVDSPGYNEPINWYHDSCKVTDFKAIANLRLMANVVRLKGLRDDQAEWVKIS